MTRALRNGTKHCHSDAGIPRAEAGQGVSVQSDGNTELGVCPEDGDPVLVRFLEREQSLPIRGHQIAWVARRALCDVVNLIAV